METQTIKKVLNFLEKKEKKMKPYRWKLINNEPLTEEELNIKGNLKLARTNITSVPKGLNVSGYIDLIDCQNLKSIQEDLYVMEDLYLGGCLNFESLPKNSFVGGDVHLEYCKNLTFLPAGFKVGGDLIIFKTPLTKFSDDELFDMIKPYGYIKGKISRL
jgi:hypothetical protein